MGIWNAVIVIARAQALIARNTFWRGKLSRKLLLALLAIGLCAASYGLYWLTGGIVQVVRDLAERIEVLAARSPMMVAPAQAQAYIHNPLAEAHLSRRGGRNASSMARLFSTHPSTDERIRRLRAM